MIKKNTSEIYLNVKPAGDEKTTVDALPHSNNVYTTHGFTGRCSVSKHMQTFPHFVPGASGIPGSSAWEACVALSLSSFGRLLKIELLKWTFYPL